MTHVFVSYSTKNADYAYKLVDKLRSEGFNVWIDNAELRSSDNWWESIVRALRAADAFIVIMSPESRASRWVQREVTLADEWGKPAFPLLLEGEKFEIYVLTQFHKVLDGRLPTDSFYADLARFSKREPKQGEIVTHQEILPLVDDSAIQRAVADAPEPEDLPKPLLDESAIFVDVKQQAPQKRKIASKQKYNSPINNPTIIITIITFSAIFFFSFAGPLLRQLYISILTPSPSATVPSTQTSEPSVTSRASATVTSRPNSTATSVIIVPATVTQELETDSAERTPLSNGRGITTGQIMNDGNFEIEGYCALLNPAYGVSQDDTNWYCTFEGQNALILRQKHFNDICRRTYNNPNAVAYQNPNTTPRAFSWRCVAYSTPLTATPDRSPVLAMDGRGMSTGTLMNNGNFEVEAYCSSINPTYGITRDDNYWYCTENGQRIITLGVAEFDDICIRTYNNPAAYAEQDQSNAIPPFRWRCYVLQ